MHGTGAKRNAATATASPRTNRPQLNTDRHKTSMCRNLKSCSFGADCTFAHSEAELRDNKRVPDHKYKTKMCHNWATNGTCDYGSKCFFAHSRQELRPAVAPTTPTASLLVPATATKQQAATAATASSDLQPKKSAVDYLPTTDETSQLLCDILALLPLDDEIADETDTGTAAGLSASVWEWKVIVPRSRLSFAKSC